MQANAVTFHECRWAVPKKGIAFVETQSKERRRNRRSLYLRTEAASASEENRSYFNDWPGGTNGLPVLCALWVSLKPPVIAITTTATMATPIRMSALMPITVAFWTPAGLPAGSGVAARVADDNIAAATTPPIRALNFTEFPRKFM